MVTIIFFFLDIKKIKSKEKQNLLSDSKKSNLQTFFVNIRVHKDLS